MANKVITINGTFSPRHINESLTEEKFAEMFDKFIEENDLIFGGGWVEEDDDEQGGSREAATDLLPNEVRQYMTLPDAKKQYMLDNLTILTKITHIK